MRQRENEIEERHYHLVISANNEEYPSMLIVSCVLLLWLARGGAQPQSREGSGQGKTHLRNI